MRKNNKGFIDSLWFDIFIYIIIPLSIMIYLFVNLLIFVFFTEDKAYIGKVEQKFYQSQTFLGSVSACSIKFNNKVINDIGVERCLFIEKNKIYELKYKERGLMNRVLIEELK